MPRRLVIAITCSCALLSACASTSADIDPVLTPIAKYTAMSCDQLAKEAGEVDNEIALVSKVIDGGSAGDRIAMGVGVVFWPALFLIDGKGAEKDHLGLLKGERQSIEDASLENNCATPARPATPDKPGLQAVRTKQQATASFPIRRAP